MTYFLGSLIVLLFLFQSTLSAAGITLRGGENSYIVANPSSDLQRRVIRSLAEYLRAVTGVEPTIVAELNRVPAGKPAVLLKIEHEPSVPVPVVVPAGSEEAFVLWTGALEGRPIVLASARTEIGLKRAVHRLVIESRQKGRNLDVPEMSRSEAPWIPEREWTVCPWAPQQVRGVFVNPHADNRMNIWLYSDRQLADYVAMYDWFGYSGAQLMETAYSYSVMGSPEAFQDRQRKLAQQVRRNGQNVSLWVWAAEFSGYGWLDPDVTYTPALGKTAFDDPHVRRGFEKYYDHYAKLAPDVDRLIGHFYDPGHLREWTDVFQYMRLLEQKFKARNPKIKMSIDAWAAGIDYLEALAANGFGDYLLLEMSMPHLFKPGERERYHQEAARQGLELGVWGWYTTEYETDQLASMYVNAQLLKDFYNRMKEGALQVHPVVYWSEMEAHHLNNIYSMYAAAQLLWNPDRDPRQILSELTEAIWGPKNGPKVLAALELIQDVRSGPRWETYWWTLPEYRLGTAVPGDDLARAERSLAQLSAMTVDSEFVVKLPLPFPPATLVELMLPHLEQIREFARFRIEAGKVRAMAEAGGAKAELSRLLQDAWRPIPEFNTWIGTFGQPEARMQELMITGMAKEFDLQVQAPAWLQEEETQRLLQKIQNMQRRERGVWTFTPQMLNEFHWKPEKLIERLQALVKRGWVKEAGEGHYQLSNWQHFRNLY